MANEEHLAILRQGVEVWNQWRKENPFNPQQPDLSGVNLSGQNLNSISFTDTNLSGAILHKTKFDSAYFGSANLSGADLREANLGGAYFPSANLQAANLQNAFLSEAELSQANLSGADLSGAILYGASFIRTDLRGAKISGCKIHGVSVWNIITDETTIQDNLVINPSYEPEITVDNIEIAQFVYLLIQNEKLRGVIDTLTTKSVLILGRFTEERKTVLDAIRNELRQRGYVPILFDFEKPANRDLTETVMTLASLARFVIADLSDPHSIPHELMSFAEKLLSVPVKPIFCPVPAHPNEYPMLEHLRRYPHVLPVYRYDTAENLIATLRENVIEPAEAKVKEMRPEK